MNRRQWLYGAGLMAGVGPARASLRRRSRKEESASQPKPLELSQYEPKSMLQLHESHVERSKFPLIDFHTHISGSTKSDRGVELSPDREYLGTAEGVAHRHGPQEHSCHGEPHWRIRARTCGSCW